MWICLENCIVAPECQYCQLIYQINYSYKCNKHADVITFRNSVLGPIFFLLEDIYAEQRKEGNEKTTINHLKNLYLKNKKKVFIRFRF